MSDEIKHWKTCPDCGAPMKVEKRVVQGKTFDADVCTNEDCGQEYIDIKEHEKRFKHSG